MIGWYDSSVNNMGVTDQYLTGIKAPFMRWHLYLALLW